MRLSTLDRILSYALRGLPIHDLHRFARDSQETSLRFRSFAIAMKLERQSVSASDLNSMDRRVIQVDMQPTHAGITAALRRAFEAAATEPSDRDFAELLRRLN